METRLKPVEHRTVLITSGMTLDCILMCTDAPKEITPDLIIQTVADHYNVPQSDIASGKRNAEIVLPRQVFMYLCREHTDTPLANIAKYVGKKDHTTVKYGHEKIKEELEKNEVLKNNVSIIIRKLNPS